MHVPERKAASRRAAERLAKSRAWAAPSGPNGLLCDPPLGLWEQTVAENRAVLDNMRFDVAGVDGAEMRRRARRRLLELAGVDGANAPDGSDAADGAHALAAPSTSAPDERPIIVTGHQPQFYHPGVWVKAFAVAAEARRQGAVGVNVVVDHDAGELAAEIPWRTTEGAVRLGYTKEYLVSPVGGRPLETLPVPSADEVEAFLQRIEEHVQTLHWPEGIERVRAFADALRAAAQSATTAAELGWMTRRLYEKAFGEELVPDVPVSRISQTPEFLRFFVHWAYNAEAMRTAYNEALADYRREHRVRSQANPFPDLLVYPGQGVELPFWGLTPEGVRRKLYALKTPDGVVLSHLEGEFARIPLEGDAAVEALIAAGVQVRPRAVPLTVFHRLFVADLFVHGTGGGQYDQVTDRFIEAVFGVSAPTYAVVSGTVHLPLGELPVQPGAIAALRRKLRDLRFNPQRFSWEIDELSEELALLLRRKEELIDEIQRAQPRRGGRSSVPSAKRVLTREIEHVNEALYKALAPVEQKARQQLAALEAQAAVGAIATRRTYPFFLYDPASMWDLLCVGCDEGDDGGQLTLAFPVGGR